MDVRVSILQLLKLPDGTVKVLVEGINRVKITRLSMIMIRFYNLLIMPKSK